MKQLLILILTLLYVIEGVSQSRSFGTLPMVQNPKAKNRASANGTIDSSKYERALKIYNKLRDARGDFRFPVPEFIMTTDESMVAAMDYNKLEIILEEKAYNVCASFGKDSIDAALAFLLGHELSHYYEKHAWKRSFVQDFKDLPIGMLLDSLQDDVANETEADYLGGFLAYTGGFGFFNKGSDIIAGLYRAYGLDNKLSGYPSLEDRQVMSKRTSEKINRLIQVFDMANLLNAIGSYGEANEYYKHVLTEYQSREIYNNLGVSILLDAIDKYFREGELRFRLPIQLDLQSSSRGESYVKERTALIKEALLQFEAAISLDPNYSPAYINKACAYFLLGDYVRAEFYANIEARNIAELSKNEKTIQDIQVLLGILKATNGDSTAAKNIFESAFQSGNKLAGINLKILNRIELGVENETSGGRLKVEQIDSQNLQSKILEDEFKNMQSLTINKKLKFHYVPTQGPSSYLLMSELGSSYTYFHCTNPDYKLETARKISIGMNSDAITNTSAYGNPSRTIETPNGRILVYKSKPIIFIIGKNDKLERWIVYAKD